MIQCVLCVRFVSGDPAMASNGFGKCTAGKKYRYMSAVYPHECRKFEQADGEVVAKRVEWLNSKGKKE